MKLKMTMVILVLATILLPTHLIFAGGKTICGATGENAKCTEGEVGAFMKDITVACGNTGDCSIADITQVFANVGNWILGLIGALVFLMYIWGGINILVGGASPERVATGKKTIRTATIGLVIVFVAYAGIYTLKNNILGGASYGGPSAYTQCTQNTIGQACGTNMLCTANGCLPKCNIDHPEGDWACTDSDRYCSSLFNQYCERNKCPGEDNIVCCETSLIPDLDTRCRLEQEQNAPPPLPEGGA